VGVCLSRTFPNCTPEFVAALAGLVKTGGDTEVEFEPAILQNYHGETATYVVLK
jgi:7-cyano-7-deazaguanine synthase in queuosine biosynthesis